MQPDNAANENTDYPHYPPLSSTPKDPSTMSVSSNSSTPSKLQSFIGSNITQSLTIEPRPRFTIYKINVNSFNKRWVVHRRYSDFVLLNKKLQREIPSVRLNLPPKRWFRDNFNTNFIQKRKEALQDFISTIFSVRQLFDTKSVQVFFRLNDPPGPNEDLETSQMYCESLEQSCNDLRMMCNQQGIEIGRLNREIQELSFHHEQNDLDKNAATTTLLLAKSNLEERIQDLTTKIDQKNAEITRLKDEYRQSEAYANAVRLQERQRRDQQIREHAKIFMQKQQKVDEIYNGIVNKLTDHSKVKIDVGGRCIDVNPFESVNEQERELRSALFNARQEMELLYKEHIDSYRKDLEDCRIIIEKQEKTTQNLQTEVDTLKTHLHSTHEKNAKDILSRDQCIQQYQSQLCSQNNYISSLEQRYFYSLILGVKLNMALYGQIDDLLGTNFEPARLFLEVRDFGINIENWPSWVARKLSKAPLNSPKSN